MRVESRGATLAAAQLAVAHSYGFASWRKLKAYVDALRDDGERLVNAVRMGDLDVMRAVLDRSPELVNATTDLEFLLRPSDALAMHFEMDGVREFFMRIQDEAEIVWPLESMEYGTIEFGIWDRDGYTLAFAEQVELATRSDANTF
jgi:hypothetical protein